MIRLFCLREERRLAARRAFACVVKCYAASLLASLLFLPLVLHYSGTLARAAFAATAYVIAVAAAAVVTGEIQFLRFRERLLLPKRTIVVAFARVLLWLAPVAVLCAGGIARGILAVAALAFVSGRMLGRLWRLLSGDEDEVDVAPSRGAEFSLHFLEQRDGESIRIGSTLMVFLAYLGIAAKLNGHSAFALLCIAISCFWIAWEGDRYSRSDRPFHAAFSPRSLAYAGLAIVVTFLALPLANRGSNHAGVHTGARENPLHSAVVLTDFKRVAPLILSPLNIVQKQTWRGVSRIASIPFSGEYWFLPWPLWYLPASAFREEGDPTNVNVNLNDSGRLVMQAHQRIGRSVATRDCRWIDVVVNDEDRDPKTISLELVLVDSSAGRQKSQSLGVESLGTPMQVLASASMEKTRKSVFRFAVPARGLRWFDELVLLFHLDRPRSGRGASVSIERFDFGV